MTEKIIYISSDGKTFFSKTSCESHELYLKEREERLNNFVQRDSALLEKLILDLREAKEKAYNTDIIDTIGSPQARAIKYITSVCKIFVENNKESLNYY